jgi:hypothetical protein
MHRLHSSLATAWLLCSSGAFAQQEVPPVARTDSGKFAIEGYVEAFYLYNSNKPNDGNVPYFVSFNRHNEFNINLAYVSGRYTSDRVRGVFTPGFGTYMNANYAAEPATLKNILEANVGLKLFAKKDIWLDMGVLPSPYTNETAVSFDQPTLTRSFAPEYVPYFVSGARLTLPFGKRIRFYGYLLNGWQQMQDVNSTLAFGSWLEYRPSSKLSINWNVFVGDERSELAPLNRMRHLQDIYFIYTPIGRWSFTASAYGGWQYLEEEEGGTVVKQWWQANATARYACAPNRWIYGRIETFNDPQGGISVSATGLEGFEAVSGTLGYDANVSSMVKLRLESRFFSARDDAYLRDEITVSNEMWLVVGLTAKFK